MTVARRVLVIALVIQALGFIREIVFDVGLERYVAGVATLSEPTLVIATLAFVGALAVLVPVWRGSRRAPLAAVPVMIVLLVTSVPSLGAYFGSPSVANFAAWLMASVTLIAGAIGLPFGIVASLESVGRLRPSRAIRPDGGFGAAAVFIAGAVGSLVGMTAVAVAVAASPASGSPAAVSAAPDATLAVTLHELRFEPERLVLATGQTTAVFVTNQDPFDHSFDVNELDVHVPVPAGKTVVVMVDPTAGGSLRLYCRIPGHTEAGMVASLVVR